MPPLQNETRLKIWLLYRLSVSIMVFKEFSGWVYDVFPWRAVKVKRQGAVIIPVKTFAIGGFPGGQNLQSAAVVFQKHACGVLAKLSPWALLHGFDQFCVFHLHIFAMQTCMEYFHESILKFSVTTVYGEEFNRKTRSDIIYRNKYIFLVGAVNTTPSSAIQLRAAVVVFSIDFSPSL